MNYPVSITSMMGDVVDVTSGLPYGSSDSLLEYLQTIDSSIVQLHYMHGPVKELYETLAEMQEGITTPAKRWPLIWLVEDITIDRRNANGMGELSCRVVIAYPTKSTYKSAERETLVFAPILRPIYRTFLTAISMSGPLDMPDEFFGIPHRVTERKYWGNDEKTESALTTFVDAIDIQDLELKINYQNCYTELNP